jgi:hypothetical protein
MPSPAACAHGPEAEFCQQAGRFIGNCPLGDEQLLGNPPISLC